MSYIEIIAKLKSLSNRHNLEGMARFGINPRFALGIPVAALRKLAKDIGKDHDLALRLWDSKIHEAMILASMVDDPKHVTAKQMDRWVESFDSWDLCDQCCGNLFDKTQFAYKKAVEWSGSGKEFVRRAGYTMMAELAVHDKGAGDELFIAFLPIIKEGATDERNFVKKAVNWSLRQIGKRNERLNRLAISTADEIKSMDSKSAKWIAKDALRELKAKKF